MVPLLPLKLRVKLIVGSRSQCLRLITATKLASVSRRATYFTTAKDTINWFKDEGAEVPKWPASSPEMNPIENLWHIIQQTLYDERRVYNDKKELKNAIDKAVANIDKGMFEKLIDSMSRSLQALIYARGGATRY